MSQIIEKKIPFHFEPTTRITPSDAGSSSKNDAARTTYNRLLECLRLNEPSLQDYEIDEHENFGNFFWKWATNVKKLDENIPPESCTSKSSEEGGSLDALSHLSVADSPEITNDTIKESSSYEPLLSYLQSHPKTVHCAIVADGKYLESKRLFDQDIYTLRSKAGASAHDVNEQVLFRFQVSGATDLVVLNSAVPVRIGRHNVKFAIEVKTPANLQKSKFQGPLREAIVQLIGLNADNLNNAPPVLLTNLSNFHVVLHLVLSVANPLKFNIVAQKCHNLPSALTLSLKLSDLPALGRNFARPPTPVFDQRHGSYKSSLVLIYLYLTQIYFYFVLHSYVIVYIQKLIIIILFY